MKILPLVKGIQNDITSSSVRLKQSTIDGYRIADRTSKVYGQGYLKKYFNVTRIVTSKVLRGTTMKEVPYLAGAIGTFLPIPLTGPIFLGLGFLARISAPGAIAVYDKISKSLNADKKDIIV